MAKLGVRFNLVGGGLSQVTGWNFNSVVELGGNLIAAGSAGIKILGGNLDGDTNIDSILQTPMHQLNVENPKRVRKLYIRYVAEDILTIKCTTNENAVGFTITLPASLTETVVSHAFPGNRKIKGTEFQFRLINTNGADFTISHISVLLVPLTRSRGLR